MTANIITTVLMVSPNVNESVFRHKKILLKLPLGVFIRKVFVSKTSAVERAVSRKVIGDLKHLTVGGDG